MLTLVIASDKSIKDYSKIEEVLGPPNLIQIQSGSFDWFQDQGIRDLLEEISPIQDSMREGISADIAKGRTPRQILAMLIMSFC